MVKIGLSHLSDDAVNCDIEITSQKMCMQVGQRVDASINDSTYNYVCAHFRLLFKSDYNGDLC